MIKLMKLEAAKMQLGWYVKTAVIASFFIVLFMYMICYVENMEGRSAVADMDEAIIVLGSFVRAVFIVMAAVLIGKLIIDEYKNKTISVMFMYPVSRKKLLASKLTLIAVITFISIVISNMITLSLFVGINHYVKAIPEAETAMNYASQLASIVAFAFAAAGASLIPLYFGMRKHSIPATIVSSLLIVALTSSHNPVISLASIIYIPLGLAVIGIVIAWLSIWSIETVDVL